jgi:hypothetical protein
VWEDTAHYIYTPPGPLGPLYAYTLYTLKPVGPLGPLRPLMTLRLPYHLSSVICVASVCVCVCVCVARASWLLCALCSSSQREPEASSILHSIQRSALQVNHRCSCACLSQSSDALLNCSIQQHSTNHRGILWETNCCCEILGGPNFKTPTWDVFY